MFPTQLFRGFYKGPYEQISMECQCQGFLNQRCSHGAPRSAKASQLFFTPTKSRSVSRKVVGGGVEQLLRFRTKNPSFEPKGVLFD